MIREHATSDGTRRFVGRSSNVPPAHFRHVQGLALSSIGLGTYLGDADAVTDALVQNAVATCVARGVNVIDCAINYRNQLAERAVGAALADLIARGALRRDEVVVATKGGFIPYDGTRPARAADWVTRTVVDPGFARADEIVGGVHCLAPRWIEHEIDQSRANLGLETIDIYYLHNPETQLDEVEPEVFFARMRAAFRTLEEAVRQGKIVRYGVATWDGLRVEPSAPSHFSLERLVGLAGEVAGTGGHHLRVVQLPLSLGMPEALTVESQTVDGEKGAAVLAAKTLGMITMASAPLAQAKLVRGLPRLVKETFVGCKSDAQRALQFARSAPAIDVAVVGMKKPEHLEDDLALCAIPPSTTETFMRLFGG